MSLILRRSYGPIKSIIFLDNHLEKFKNFTPFILRTLSNEPQFINSTVLVEMGFNFHELTLPVRKVTNIINIGNNHSRKTFPSTSDALNYKQIQTAFNECVNFRDVLTLLSNCPKITPNVALGAIERIYEIEKYQTVLYHDNIYIANLENAILDKLLKVVLKTEDTLSIINILNTVSGFMDAYKYKFCDKLLLRVHDNMLTMDELCEFALFLSNNKNDSKYSETLDNLWIGFCEREAEINEKHLKTCFSILPSLKTSKRAVKSLLEQKLCLLWHKVNVADMSDILKCFAQEKCSDMQCYSAVGKWLYRNIQGFDDDSFLDIISKLTKLGYTDKNIEKSVKKYVLNVKCAKISHMLVIGILNYCMQFQIRSINILNVMCKCFLRNSTSLSQGFLKSYILPFGHLYFDPAVGVKFWSKVEKISSRKFDQLPVDDISLIVLSCLYLGKHPLNLINKLFSSEYLVKVDNPETIKKLHLIDTALSIECEEHNYPLLPKYQWSESLQQDPRIENLINKIYSNLVLMAGGEDRISKSVLIPNLCSHETYLIDIMLHPTGFGCDTFNWNKKIGKNENTAVLIHLPNHYCSDDNQLVGPQMMRKKHLKILGFKVISLKYTLISDLYVSGRTKKLNEYLRDSLENAESDVSNLDKHVTNQ